MSEARVDVEQIKEEWLVGNAVVAFVGALLMAQTWEPSEVRNEIPLLGVTGTVTPQMVVLGIVAFLAILSFALAVASAVPPLRTWAVKQAWPFSYLLEILMWMAFLFSLVSALAEIPSDQWWAGVLTLGGLALGLFLCVRMVLRPLIPPAKWLGQWMFRLARKAWRRFVVSRRQPDGADDTDGE